MRPHARLLCALTLLSLIPTAFAQHGSKSIPVDDNMRPDNLPPDIPNPAPTVTYPLRLHIFTVSYGGARSTYRGFGSANLVTPGPVLGFEYNFDCAVPFTANAKPDAADATYPARWLEPNLRLELSLSSPDNARHETCELRLVPRPTSFDPDQAHKLLNGPYSRVKPKWNPPDSIAFTSNPDFPIRFRVYKVTHSDDAHAAHGKGNGMLLGKGRSDPNERVIAFDYDDCARSFTAVSQKTDFYQARWLKPGKQLELLTQEPGTGKIHTCPLRITADPAP